MHPPLEDTRSLNEGDDFEQILAFQKSKPRDKSCTTLKLGGRRATFLLGDCWGDEVLALEM